MPYNKGELAEKARVRICPGVDLDQNESKPRTAICLYV